MLNRYEQIIMMFSIANIRNVFEFANYFYTFPIIRDVSWSFAEQQQLGMKCLLWYSFMTLDVKIVDIKGMMEAYTMNRKSCRILYMPRNKAVYIYPQLMHPV